MGRAENLAGTGALLRLALRRDRILLPAWMLGLAGVAGFSVAATADLYPDATSRAAASQVFNSSPSLVALYGRVEDPSSLGALSLIKLTAFGAAIIATLMVTLVVRHTRAEESDGRLELISAGRVGRHASLSAALTLSIMTSLAIGISTAVALVAAGLPTVGALAFGAGWASAGVTFAAIGGVAAQLTTSSRAANGLGVATVGGAYLLRALGDLPERGPRVFTWLSPIGWSQEVRPFAGDRFAVVGLPILAAIGLTVTAFALRNRRDLGAGMWSERPGPAVGSMHTTWALTLRLNRNLWVGWAVGVAVFGALVGSLTTNVSGLVNSPGMQDLIEAMGGTQSITDAFLSTELSILGSIIAAFGISSVTHLRSEETAGRAEMLLAAPLDRRRWAAGHLVAALLGVAALMVIAGLAVGFGYAADAGDSGRLGELVAAAVARIPAAWVFVGLGAAIFGWAPQRTRLVWASFVVAALLIEFGPLLQVPQWLVDLSPFAHSPKLPGAETVLVPLLVLTALAASAAAVGLFGFLRRDVTA